MIETPLKKTRLLLLAAIRRASGLVRSSGADGAGSGMRGFKPVIAVAGVGIAFFLAVFIVVSPSAFSQLFSDVAPPTPLPPNAAAPVRPPADPKTERYDFKLGKDDTFYSLMSSLKTPGPEISAIAEKARPIYDLKRLRKGTVLRVYSVDNRWSKIEYAFGDYETLVVESAGGVRAYKTELPHEKKTTLISGTIENSLYEDGVKAGADPRLIIELSNIFAWDVDFASDLRHGDSFSILAEMLYVNGRPVRAGRILGAEMVNGGRKYTAIYFADKNGGGYYDAGGKSLERTLLKSPLRYSRITSYFTNRRFHPVLKVYRPHHGIDYAAPTGTPVEAAGSGKVIFAGWKNGFGNFIAVRHIGNFTTGYGHLSRIARGIRPGAKVRQGEVIGFVGATGIATGPHLHYEVRINNRPVNPLSIKSIPERSLAGRERAKFASTRRSVMGRLEATAVAGRAPRANLLYSKSN